MFYRVNQKEMRKDKQERLVKFLTSLMSENSDLTRAE